MTKVFKVLKDVGRGGKTASGQKVKNVGRVWVKIAESRNKTVAERTAQHARVDDPDAFIRIEVANG